MNAKDKLIDAFFALMTVKPFGDIGVSELCQLAKVHRTTFYAYYDNIFDLLPEAKEYALGKFRNKMKDKQADEDFLSLSILVPYLDFIKEHANLYSAFLCNPEAFDSRKEFEGIYQNHFLKDARRKNHDSDEWMVRKITEFFLFGINGLIESWLKGGCAEPSERIAEVIVRIPTSTPSEPRSSRPSSPLKNPPCKDAKRVR